MGYEPSPCETHMRANLGEHMLQGLRDLIVCLPSGLVMAEIGVYAGESTRLFIESGKVKRLYAVDPWAGDYEQDEVWHSPFPWEEVRQAFLRYAAAHPEIDVWRMKSRVAAKQFEDGTLDFVYIDANHAYREVKRDIAAWLPKIKFGGWLGGHDWAAAYPGVMQAVRAYRLVRGSELPQRFGDTSWLVQV